MSAQTGTLPPQAPTSKRFADRALFRARLLAAQPNPLWIRELRQSARLGRTPVILAVVAVLVILLIASVGGIVSTDASPATTGVVLFQTFFSVAYFVVTLVGPAVAANSIASEREGRTWEAVILTGLSPKTIARGKFLAAFTSIAMYVVMLAPVGALPFLFGGVTATEVVVAFGGLFLIALLAVAFGLAISSKMASLRAAIVVTLLLAFPLTIAAFLAFGVSLSFAAHKAWVGVVEGPPIWLPTAYERAPVDTTYCLFLVVLPVLSIAVPAWFLYEVTIANLTSITDDRSSGLKRWFLVSAPALTFAAGVPIPAVAAHDRVVPVLAGIGSLFAFFVFCVFLFVGDPIGPSRRVAIHWQRRGAGALRRFLGPGVMRSSAMLLAVGIVCLGALSVYGFFSMVAVSGSSSNDATRVLVYAAYTIAFYVFVVGLAAFLRARATSPLVARVLLFALLFVIAIGPWIVAAISGLLSDHGASRDALIVAAPSPFYVAVMIDAVGRTSQAGLVLAGIAATVSWSVLGLVLVMAAAERCRTVIRRHEAMLAESDRVLAAEDEAAHAAEAPADEVPASPAPAE